MTVRRIRQAWRSAPVMTARAPPMITCKTSKSFPCDANSRVTTCQCVTSVLGDLIATTTFKTVDRASASSLLGTLACLLLSSPSPFSTTAPFFRSRVWNVALHRGAPCCLVQQTSVLHNHGLSCSSWPVPKHFLAATSKNLSFTCTWA
jgi:hypothetical protein